MSLSETRIGAVILAAGSSSRLGEPKQLVHFQSKSLLQQVIDEVAQIEFEELVVILGANEVLIKKKVNFKSAKLIQNPNWEEGMASSIRLAVEEAERRGLNALLILLSDQPFVNSELLRDLIKLYSPGKELIVASEYNNIFGVPVLFDRHYFQDLKELTGDTGARKLIKQYQDKVKGVKFEKGLVDIDTQEDLSKLQKHR